jgi:thiamine-phosphate pyrophosphorylase
MATAEPPACRLYLVAPHGLERAAALEVFAVALAEALEAGEVACVLLRAAGLDDRAARGAAQRLAPLAQDRGVAFLVEDRPEVARQSGADGVHLSQAGAPVARVREMIGPEAIVGVGCGLSRHEAMAAGEAGADYVGFAGPEAALVELLAWWQATMTPPCVAMNGVTFDNAAALARAGADFLAVGAPVWEHPNGPAVAIAAFAARLAPAAG